MTIPEIPARAPVDVAVDEMVVPDSLDVRFSGFDRTAFRLLDELRRHPHIEQYRKDKELIGAHIQEPFKQFRDDLVVNWVLPNRLDLETERNVFSRLLKNDFGAGGCHHHLWMSFYRTGRRRLSDVQLAHSIWPDAFHVVVYLGAPAPDLYRRVHRAILDAPATFFDLVNPLLQEEHTTLHCDRNTGRARENSPIDQPIESLPPDFANARGIALRTSIPRERVLELRSGLVAEALNKVLSLWPLYRYFLANAREE